jgi:serine/threonine protein kinase
MISIEDNVSIDTNASCLVSASDSTTKVGLSGLDDDRDVNQLEAETHKSDSICEGQFLGRYRLIRLLGEGTFGRVWLAYDEELLRQVAIKVPSAGRFQRPEDATAYLEEARNAARLDHPHIVPVYDVGYTKDGGVFVVSKFIEGCTLCEKIKEKCLAHNESVILVEVIGRALHHAHSRHLIHRDAKPANILLEAETGYPYLADFGLAIPDNHLKRPEMISGTPAYMSPEQACGCLLDCRSDQFSLGIILYELLTGVRPFGGNTIQLLRAIVNAMPIKPRDLDPSIPVELERICLKALSPNPADRYATTAEFSDELSSWNKRQTKI